ncbi:Pathogenesis-related protein 5 [Linum perenne]
MKVQHMINAAAFILFSLIGIALGHQVNFYVHNKCPFSIWPATAANGGHPVIAEGGFYLPSGSTQRVTAPWNWSGRFWARTGCTFHSPTISSNWLPTCDTGDCDGRLQCNGLIGTPPATLVEVTLQGDKGGPAFYDVSLVDGYNIPVAVLSRPLSAKCAVSGCVRDLNGCCPPELQVLSRNGSGRVVGCKSACKTFNIDSFCCRNEYGRPEKCRPNVYSKMFKDACPSYYSYAYDSPPPLVNCTAKEYVITFCPSSWGVDDGHIGDGVVM